MKRFTLIVHCALSIVHLKKENIVATRSDFSGKQVGESVAFGVYPQTKKGKDSTPIEWLVLENDGSSVLLISKFILDSVPYNTKKVDMNWRDCSLRVWLNSDFYTKAFSESDKACIVESTVSGNGSMGKDDENVVTTDKVFLLNIPESKQHFAKAADRIAMGTEFAKSKKSFTGKLEVYKEHSPYWLRNRSDYGPQVAAVVDNGGMPNPTGGNIHLEYEGVRPVIRVGI